jgi:predicted nucleotidyltransferase
MRIKENEKKILKEAVMAQDPNAEVYLFGSRADDEAKGGDIDVLVLSQCLTFKDKLKIKARMFETLEDQTIHLIIGRDQADPFVRIALDRGVPL